MRIVASSVAEQWMMCLNNVTVCLYLISALNIHICNFLGFFFLLNPTMMPLETLENKTQRLKRPALSAWSVNSGYY